MLTVKLKSIFLFTVKIVNDFLTFIQKSEISNILKIVLRLKKSQN